MNYRKLLSRFIVAPVLALGLGAAAQAAPTQPADQVIKTATEDFQALIQQNHEQYRKDLESFYKVVDDKVVPHFDSRAIAQLVLGRNWRGASAEQRDRFEAAFKDSLIRTYARAMLDYHDSIKAEWAPLRAAEGADDVTVNAKILRENAPPIALAFSVHAKEDQWKIYDISVEGLSLITNFRSQINVEVKAKGLDAVIKKLEDDTYFEKPASSGSG